MERSSEQCALAVGAWEAQSIHAVVAVQARAALLTAAQCATYDELKLLFVQQLGWEDNIQTHFTGALHAAAAAASVKGQAVHCAERICLVNVVLSMRGLAALRLTAVSGVAGLVTTTVTAPVDMVKTNSEHLFVLVAVQPWAVRTLACPPQLLAGSAHLRCLLPPFFCSVCQPAAVSHAERVRAAHCAAAGRAGAVQGMGSPVGAARPHDDSHLCCDRVAAGGHGHRQPVSAATLRCLLDKRITRGDRPRARRRQAKPTSRLSS